ncbi:MAG: thioredoxin family protein [Myxococcota bacterium]|nr:thioredoxin family protein [Myxococcota bacterium]MDW8362946.1 thioredoxin family protein [Myxococcales bacterium]
MAVEGIASRFPLGSPCPDFALPDAVSSRIVRRDELHGPALLVIIACNHCPYVVHVLDGITAVGNDYVSRGVAVVALNANSERTHPQDGPPHMKALAERMGWRFPFLFDATQQTARALGAACTPDFYVFDAQRKLVYHGQLDDARPGNGKPVTGADLRAALDAVLAGRPVPQPQKPSLGCSIKWHPEPGAD